MGLIFHAFSQPFVLGRFNLLIIYPCYCRHSQNRYKTDCPTGTRKMWDGFSLAYVQGNGKAHGQELGIVDKIDVFFFADLLSCGCCAIS